MIQTGLLGGSSAVMKEQSWLVRDVQSTGYVKTDQTSYLHLYDPGATEQRWKELTSLLGISMNAIIIDEDGSGVYVDLHDLVLQPGYVGIKCVLSSKRTARTCLIVYEDGHLEITTENPIAVLAIRVVASRLKLLLMK
jgi:hypothetical protein